MDQDTLLIEDTLLEEDTLLNESIARVTGDDVRTIAAHGFQAVDRDGSFDDGHFEESRPPLVIDWDTHQPRSQRRLLPLRKVA